ncbi:MAG: hypothetical protein EAZ27_01995, partial [Cytophagales bacterium]
MKKVILMLGLSVAQIGFSQSSFVETTLPGTGRIKNANLFMGKLYFSQQTENGTFIDAVWDGTTVTSFGTSLQKITTTAGFSGNFFNLTATGIQYFKRNNSIYSFDGTNFDVVANQPASITYGSIVNNEIYQKGIDKSLTNCIISGTVAGFIKFYSFDGSTFTDVTPANDIIGIDEYSTFSTFRRTSSNEDKAVVVKRANAGNSKYALVSFKATNTITDFDLQDLNTMNFSVNNLGFFNDKTYFSYATTISSNFPLVLKIGSYNKTTGIIQTESWFDQTNLTNFYMTSYLGSESLISYGNATLSGVVGFFNGNTIIGVSERMAPYNRASFIGNTNGKNYLLAQSSSGSNFEIYDYNNGACTLVTITGERPNSDSGLEYGSSFEEMTTEAQGAKELYPGILPLYTDDNNQLIFHFFNGNSFENVTINGFRGIDNGSKMDKGRIFLEGRTNGTNNKSVFLFLNGKTPEYLHPNDNTLDSFDDNDAYTASGDKYLIGISTTIPSSVGSNTYKYYILTPNSLVNSINSENIENNDVFSV